MSFRNNAMLAVGVATFAAGCGAEAEPRLAQNAIPAVEYTVYSDDLYQSIPDTTRVVASDIAPASALAPATITEGYQYPEITITEGVLYGVEVEEIEEITEITKPQSYRVDFTESTELQIYGVNDEEVAVGSPPVPEIIQPDDQTASTGSSNLPQEFEDSRIQLPCEAVLFDIPNDVPVYSDTVLKASIKKIPVEIPDDELTQEIFAVAGTSFGEDPYFYNLKVGSTYIFSLDATVGVVNENIVSLVVGGIEPCENEGDSDDITSINGPIDMPSETSRAVRGQPIVIGN